MAGHAMIRSRWIHLLFDVGVIAKGIDGALEIVGGVLLLLIEPSRLQHLAVLLTAHELAEDPRDPLAGYVARAAGHLAVGTQHFASIYLLWHGLVKAVLVAGLLAKVRWAYPTGILAFAFFVIYQLVRFATTHATELIWLSLLDLLVIVLTWLEYRRLRLEGVFAS